METPSASIALEKLGVPHTLFHHEGSVESFEQAARERIKEDCLHPLLRKMHAVVIGHLT